MTLERMGGHHGYLIMVAKTFCPWGALVLLTTHQSLTPPHTHYCRAAGSEAAFKEEK